MISIESIYKQLAAHLKSVAEASYPDERPKSVADGLKSFTVIDLPSMFKWKLVGTDDFETTLDVEVFVKDRSTKQSPNLTQLTQSDDVVQAVLAKFPHRFDGFSVGKPTILFVNKSDGNGFHYSFIQATITTW